MGLAILFGNPRAQAASNFATDNADIAPANSWEFDLRNTGTFVNRPKPQQGGNLLGLEIDHVVADGFQIHFSMPVNYQHTENSNPIVAQGYMEFGIKYQFVKEIENSWIPSVAIEPVVDLPTAHPQFEDINNHTQYFVPVWISKSQDPWQVTAGGGIAINPGAGNTNWALFGLGINRDITPDLNLAGEIYHTTSNKHHGKSLTAINIGVTYNINENWHVNGSVGFGIQNSAYNDVFNWGLTVSYTF
jgi:Putative MetA-pathway of phenol degradation